MKTTIELPDDLLERAKALARAEETSLKSSIEEGLRSVLDRRQNKTGRFTLGRVRLRRRCRRG